jgi:hypothetical protein
MGPGLKGTLFIMGCETASGLLKKRFIENMLGLAALSIFGSKCACLD